MHQTKYGYTFRYTRSDHFRDECRAILDEHPGFGVEIGLLFLCDSLAKTDVRIYAETDQDIKDLDSEIGDILEQRGLPGELAGAVKQRPVNIEIARGYLESALR